MCVDSLWEQTGLTKSWDVPAAGRRLTHGRPAFFLASFLFKPIIFCLLG